MKEKSIKRAAEFYNSVLTASFALMFCLSFFSSVRAQPRQDEVVPIVGMGWLLGGVRDGKWLTSEQVAPVLNRKNDFILVGLKGLEKKGAFFTGNTTETPDLCSAQNLEFKPKTNNFSFAVGANAKWNLLPRPVNPLVLTDKTYTKAAASFLKTKGIVKTKIKITQIFRVDLDDDGQNEVIIAGSFYRRGLSESQSSGDYSFVLVRKNVNGAARNILIEGEFYTQKNDDILEPPTEREVAAIADLNGDGRMEIMIYASYYEGESATVYEFKDDEFSEVFSAGCGA